jgi:hypothetical protein
MDYRSLIKDPTSVCNDWVYRLVRRLPGPGILWVLLLIAIPLTTFGLEKIVHPIDHIRTPVELATTYYLACTLLVYVLVVPVFYASVIRAFDLMSRSVSIGTSDVSSARSKLVTPGRRFQASLIIGAVIMITAIQEVSSERWSRFLSGDWNLLDIWLAIWATVAIIVFSWFIGMPLARIIELTKFIDRAVRPILFDQEAGKSIVSIGIGAGLVSIIPLTIQTAITGASHVGWNWFYLTPVAAGFIFALVFMLLPAAALARKVRLLKGEELSWINEAIVVKTPRNVTEIAEIDKADGILNLLNYRREVENVSEWPLTARSLRGFSLYFLIPPMTWAASSVLQIIMERTAFG